ncbi:GNAT family N-acetyltransferase [Marinicella sp. S1101]|uniref:GNAT family N-acetyltransferase n=1 Tax=Marinicella marina TaxID=2996016 RepID=UPI0022609982|nr:GNAT family N-acetyltransferase [Marinicella marina]MCX7552552.1 GNAT family N-acetyltransferase [Marinicella marina]MDJ1139428.1 GNAT family N-acetyltransferase [Marinicella marina]
MKDTNNHSIRRARVEDLNCLLDFEQKIIATERPMDPSMIQDQPISYYPIAEYLEDPKTEVLVAENQTQIIGSIYGQIRPRKDFFQTSHLGYIGFMYVRKAHRGQGVSQALIDAIRSWFKQQGISEIILHVYAKNPRAIKAYEKSGFESHLIEMRFNPDK